MNTSRKQREEKMERGKQQKQEVRRGCIRIRKTGKTRLNQH